MIYEIKNADKTYTAEATDDDVAIVGTKLIGIRMVLQPENGKSIDVNVATTKERPVNILTQRAQEVLDFFDSLVPGAFAEREQTLNSTWAIEGFIAVARQRANSLRKKMMKEQI